jgi:asparagine synthase (glutamine-hydrolysing)
MYYGWQGSGQNKVFLFGSELKALAGHPSFEGQIDRNALAAFMQDGYVPTPASIYRGIFKLCPGSTLTLRGSGSEPVVTTYWSARAAVLEGVSHRSELSEVQAIAELEDLLASSVAGQLNSDAPVGAFLSGGIDSSLIVALMQRASNATVQTFTIGFEDGRFDEAPYSRRVAEHLGTMHHELTMTESDVLRILPLMPTVYDEPFADSSQIPTFMVAQLARARVKVALSGEGADEIFGGYDSYLYASRLWRQLSQVPASLRKLAARAIEAVPAAAWNTIGYITRHSRHSTGSDKAYKCSLLLRSNSPSELRRAFVQRWPAGTVIGTAGPANAEPAIPANAAENMMAIDLQQYLPDDILVKVDRAAMAVSLETRAPYLDRRVVEFAWRLPSSMKIRHGSSKWILRQLLSKYVPEALFRRPKRGFSIPVDQLLRGALRNWAEALLDPDRLRAQGYIDPNSVQLAWHRHLNGDSNRQAQLWTVLMFQAWLEARSTEGAGGQNLIAL